MIEEAMVSTPEGCTNNIPMTPNPYVSNKKLSARKSLYQFTKTLNVKHKTTVCKFVATKKRQCVVFKH